MNEEETSNIEHPHLKFDVQCWMFDVHFLCIIRIANWTIMDNRFGFQVLSGEIYALIEAPGGCHQEAGV